MHDDHDIRIAIAGEGNVDCAALVEAMKAQGWTVAAARGAEELAALASSGKYHLALLAAQNLQQMSRVLIGSLLGLQADMGLMFLVPDVQAVLDRPGTAGITSDQIFRLDTPPDQMLSVIRAELDSITAAQPRYSVFCIDDDEGFLGSMEEMLPQRMAEVFPRFQLDFDYFASPRKALVAAEGVADRLAVVICDQMMPEMKGIELLGRIKQVSPHAQRVLLTGYAALESAITAINNQVLDKYLTKPIEQTADFTATIAGLLREHHFRASRDTQQTALLAQFEFIRAISATKDVGEALDVTVGFAGEHVRADQAMVMLLEDGRLRVRAAAGTTSQSDLQANPGIPADDGLATMVLNARRPVLIKRKDDVPNSSGQWPPLSVPIMATPLACNGAALGLMLVAGKSNGQPFTRNERMFMGFIADAASVTISGLMDRKSLEQHYVDTLACLMETIEAKDSYIRGHTERVVELALALGKEIGLAEEDLKALQHAAALHDIGKIGVPDSIILKPGRLDAQEYAIMKEHPGKAFKILQHLRFLGRARMIIRGHHERFDGKGYPDGLAGEEIPLGARILAVADTYDAMTSSRPYRDAMSPAEAFAEIQVNAGKQFDPSLAVVFLKMMRASQELPNPCQALAGAARQEAGQ